MRKAQILSTDLLVSLLVVAMAVGLVVQGFDAYYQQTASTFENAKMQQIAMDAAAIEYYYTLDGITSSEGRYLGLDESARSLEYHIDDEYTFPADACVVSTRGSGARSINVYVCRGE